MSAASDARGALLERLLDHAPEFPPAELPPAQALAEDERARRSAHAFALGRYVCRAARLQELPELGRGVSVVLDAPLEAQPRVEAVEAAYREGVEELVGLADEVYVEVPIDGDLEERLERLHARGLHAKVRCGGASVPSIEDLARFVRSCRERGIAFKATAGLHHALPGEGHHGLVNVLAAAVFGDEERALSDRDPSSFALDADSFRWGSWCAGPAELARARRERLRSVGTCSFFEPIEELVALELLPA